MTAPDRYTVRFTLAQAYGPFFAMIPMVAIVNPRVIFNIARPYGGDRLTGSFLSANAIRGRVPAR